MNHEPIALDVAQAEVDRWLEHKKISAGKRETNKPSIDSMVAGFQDGMLILNEDFSITHKLKFATEGEKPIEELKYKPRLKVETTFKHLEGVKSSDADGRLCAYVAALTSLPKGLITKLDTEDYSLAQSIAVFFL